MNKLQLWCSLSLQVDFPDPSLDVLYVGPQRASSPEAPTLEELDPDLRRRLEKVCSRASNFGYEPPPNICQSNICQ